ncbi:hypothetical protein Tco_1211158, partial [Tanacetum coccineum]
DGDIWLKLMVTIGDEEEAPPTTFAGLATLDKWQIYIVVATDMGGNDGQYMVVIYEDQWKKT